MRYLINKETDPYFNMAFDEYCLEKLSVDEPVFYLWQNCPSVILGYNQEVYTEVNHEYLRENGILLVRRVTGGGAVYHDFGNLNYTIVGRSDDLERDYPGYAGMMLEALRVMGVPASLSGRNDIMVGGRKVSGFAKRVYKDRLMVHGTLMFDVDLDRLTHVLAPPQSKLQSKGIASVRSRVANLCEWLPDVAGVEAFSKRLEEILSNQYADSVYELADEELEEVKRLAAEKFSTEKWIYGESSRTSMHHSVKLACGMVEIHLVLTGNKISVCRFAGDFMGNLPVSDVEAILTGVPYDAESLMAELRKIDISQYFDGVSAEEIAQIILPGR